MITRPLSARQIKAARALLDWSQRDLVKASGLSLAAIRKMELGYISPRRSTTDAISGSLQLAGIEFLERDGVRRRAENVYIFDGACSGQEFFDDVYKTIRKSGGEVLIATSSVAAFTKLCGLKNLQRLSGLCALCEDTSIKCLAIKASDDSKTSQNIQVRLLSKDYGDITAICIYGQKIGIAIPRGDSISKLIVLDSNKLSLFARKQFLAVWGKSKQAT